MENPISKDFAKKVAKGGKKGFRMFQDILNPIPAEITDPKEIAETFLNYPFIPYAQTDHNSQYGLLIWLNSMRHLSPTHGACITSLHSYALGQPLDLIKVINPSFRLTEEISKTNKIAFMDYLTEVLVLQHETTLKDIASQSFLNLKDNGNSFVELRMSKEFGVESMSLTNHPTEHVCYVRPTNKYAPRFVGISHRWDAPYLLENTPIILPVYPNYTENDGVVSTMIHVKNPTTNLYGRPEWLSAFMSVYREFQDANYLIKQTANNFMGQALIEFEEAQVNDSSILDDDDAKDAGYENAAERFEANFMAKSEDPQSVILVSRPFGAKEAFVFQFKPNTSENFYKVMSELEEIDIVRAHQWSKRFLGENQTQGFSKDVFVDELKVKEVAVLPQLRELALKPINIAQQFAMKFFGKTQFDKINIIGTSNIDILLEMLPTDLTKNNELTGATAGDTKKDEI